MGGYPDVVCKLSCPSQPLDRMRIMDEAIGNLGTTAGTTRSKVRKRWSMEHEGVVKEANQKLPVSPTLPLASTIPLSNSH